MIPGVHQDVIDVNQHEVMEVILERLIHESLEYGDQPIRHDTVLVVGGRCHKCGYG